MPFKITNFLSAPLKQGRFITPLRLSYIQNGKPRSWEAVKSHDSVSILLYHTDRRAFLLVKQFRPAVYMHHPQHRFTYELCSGILDKPLSLEEIAAEEIDEECGFAVPVSEISKISSFLTNVGVTGSRQHLYFALINDARQMHSGGGVNDEEIILEYIPLEQAGDFLYDESLGKTPGLMFAFYWFFEQFGRRAEKLSPAAALFSAR